MTATLLSFNEVESLAAKAARGAGLGWGHAEDLGRAARWLAAHGFEWSLLLLRLLDAADAPEQVAALVQEADRAGSAKIGDTWLVESAPLALLVPMLSAVIYGRDVALMVSSVEGLLVLVPDGSVRMVGDAPRLEHDGSITVAAMRSGTPEHHTLAAETRPKPVPASALTRLSEYAARTLVPASVASRARGAGSGRSDND